MYIIFGLFCWYFSGLLGVMTLWRIDKLWTKLKVVHVILTILLWGWLGLFIWLAVAAVFFIEYLPSLNMGRILLDKNERS